MQETSTRIAVLDADNVPHFWNAIDAFGFGHEQDYYKQCLDRHDTGDVIIVTAMMDDKITGYGLLNLKPKYAYFRTHNIPEIQDLNVLPEYRRQGIGRDLIAFCEDIIKQKKGSTMGIGVGLNSSFGAAQRLYVKMGYVPDGTGVSYDRKQVSAGDFKPVDDQLCLMMVKSLS